MLDFSPFCVCVYVCSYKNKQTKTTNTKFGDSPQMLKHSAKTELERNVFGTFGFLSAL